jgi:hypothetical protein
VSRLTDLVHRNFFFIRLWDNGSLGVLEAHGASSILASLTNFSFNCYRNVAQPGLERRVWDAEVAGSNPVIPTIFYHGRVA